MDSFLGDRAPEDWCQLCGSRRLPAQDRYCAACTAARDDFARKSLPIGSLGRFRRRLVDWLGASSESDLLGILLIGAMMTAAILLLVRGA